MITAISIDGGKTWTNVPLGSSIAIVHDNGTTEHHWPCGCTLQISAGVPVLPTTPTTQVVEVLTDRPCLLCDPMCRDCPLRP